MGMIVALGASGTGLKSRSMGMILDLGASGTGFKSRFGPHFGYLSVVLNYRSVLLQRSMGMIVALGVRGTGFKFLFGPDFGCISVVLNYRSVLHQVYGYDSRFGCERYRVKIPVRPTFWMPFSRPKLSS
ncbi:unnamed protein product [Angiostrongylus costaricensis]|uniref:Peptidase A1 domain-containing protein n=1 Tax=Angiostrongylus costaricensis TaxID=334426 RepID=A0A0R3PIM4_ANGCS|nr:unnamed protein product [Angiostrongylus costaricensis]